VRYKKELKNITIIDKPKLSKAVMKERLKKAKKWQRRGRKKLMDVVKIDEKQDYLRKGTAYHCYAPLETKSLFRTQRSKLRKASKVKYEAAVCAWAGPMYLKFIAGITGLETPYKVRTSVPLWADPDTSTLFLIM
jgi:hypothetical protein